MMDWILTYTGKRFDLLDPYPDMVDIRDIAHALSMCCRFSGHTDKFYSVAQHSVLVSKYVPSRIKLAALLHDAVEAYTGDLSTPLKHVLGFNDDVEWMQEVFEGIEDAIFEKFDVRYQFCGEIKKADLRALATERNQFMPVHSDPWEALEGVEPFEDEYLIAWHPFEAEKAFLTAFYEYTKLNEPEEAA